MHGLLYLIAVLIFMVGALGGFYWYGHSLSQMAVTTWVGTFLTGMVFVALGYIVSILYELRPKVPNPNSTDRSAKQ